MVDPAFVLGAAVVKTACKIWLKDHVIAADVALGVVEIIQDKVADVREQRRVLRLFEDIEERVADSVLNSLEVEFGNVPENDREAATLAATDTLDKAKLANRDLIAVDLDALRLFRTVKSFGRRFTTGLSRDATELYERILRDCCAYAVEVAVSLPGFKAGVFGEILFRQKEIFHHIDRSFDRLPMQLGGAGAETFEPAYLRLVAKQLDKIELFGVTVSDRVGNYPLSVAYVSLSICSSTQPDESAFAGLRSGMANPGRRVTSIEEALGATRRAFIRGEAGSGKTTLLQWLAVRCGRRDFDGPMQDWNDCVPLFIRLRRYSGAKLPSPERFLADVGENIAHTMPLDWVHKLLRSGRAAVLVDGVDELPESQRRRARDWLRDLLDTFPDARYVVTSRPAAASESWLFGEAFDALEIQPMSMPDVDAFVTHWHAALADGVTGNSENERITRSRQALMETIRNHRHLRMLTVNPLMTALICALHLDRRMRLPHDRVELCSTALEMLLERRDHEREIRSSDVKISRTDKALILEGLAYWLVRNGWSDVSMERVLEWLHKKLAKMHRVRADASTVLRHLLDRSGLLRMPVEGQIDFVHKTFQEFLAARAAIEADDIGVLVQNAHDDQWREVILMAVANGRRPDQTEELLSGILRRADMEYDKQHVLQALAVGCIQHAPELSPELHQQLQKVAAELLPPKETNQAVALAGAGDLVLELLTGHKDYTPQEAIATIRMAATIGGDHAMQIITTCASKGPAVIDEVTRAWSKFDPDKFARQVLARMGPLEMLSIEDTALLEGLRRLRLYGLNCRFPHGHGNIEYISDLPDLRVFGVLDSTLESLAPIANHPGLEALVLDDGVPAIDISPLGRCPTLMSVTLPFASIADVGQLRELVGISAFQLLDEAPVGDVLSNLAPETRLESFGCWEAGSMEDIDDLLAPDQLKDLGFLLLSGAHALKSIAGIERWARTMTRIYLRAPELTDVKRLSILKLLEFANLTDTPVQSLDFLRFSRRLSTLHIGSDRDPLPDLTPLSGLRTLRYLHIWGSQPVDLSGLASASRLIVDIHGAGIRGVYGCEKLPPSVVVQRNGQSLER